MMSRVQKGLVAGVFATVAVSLLEIPNLFLNWFDPFQGVIASMLGMPGNLAVGWVVHVISGVFILGPLFAILCPRLPTDTPETKGIVFAVGAWIGGAYWFTSSTSFANPAIIVARSLSDTFAGIAPASVPAFIAAQLIGALAADVLDRDQAAAQGLVESVFVEDHHAQDLDGALHGLEARAKLNLGLAHGLRPGDLRLDRGALAVRDAAHQSLARDEGLGREAQDLAGLVRQRGLARAELVEYRHQYQTDDQPDHEILEEIVVQLGS